ncbi:MAG TPA: hypothetical protein DCE44_05220, partial [Verrucomicrobiales bacterium]|nr:hypothetical protein [Verrucomicrobiales bacterium]
EIKRLSFSSDGRHLVAVGDDSVVRGWDMSITNHLEPLWQLTHDASVTDARFSPDNRFVVTASVDGAARIWSASTGKLIAKLVGAEALAGATFTPGLGSVVTIAFDGEVRTFSTEACGPADQLLELARRRVTLTEAERKRYLPMEFGR